MYESLFIYLIFTFNIQTLVNVNISNASWKFRWVYCYYGVWTHNI